MHNYLHYSRMNFMHSILINLNLFNATSIFVVYLMLKPTLKKNSRTAVILFNP